VVAAAVGAAAAGSATRGRRRRSSVGALVTRTRPGCGFWLFGGGGIADSVVDFCVCVTAEVSTFLHACEGDAVTKLTNEKVPYFNAPIYLQNKTQIGKVDEIFGPINESVSASWISLRDCKTLPAPGDLTVRWVSCVCIGSFFC
jgi:hypothetical protein